MISFTKTGAENQMRWDRATRGFMEVWYTTITHPGTDCGIWIRYTITSPLQSEPYCELWGFVFDPHGRRSRAFKQTFPIDRLAAAGGRDDGALVRIGDAWLSETHLDGRVSSGDRWMSWSLDIEPADRTYQHLPPALRRVAERRFSTVCSPNLSVPFTGTVATNDHEWTFERDLGAQSHRWGRRHADSWAWCHCDRFEGGPAVLEGLSARSALGPLPGPTTTFIYLRYDDEDIVLNGIGTALRSLSRYRLPVWSFSASNDRRRIHGVARAEIQRMVQVTYTDPDGSHRYCANSEIASMELDVYGRDGRRWRRMETLSSTGTTHLEFGRMHPFEELPIAF